MMRRFPATRWLVAILAGAAGASCGVILGLEAPPSPDAGVHRSDGGVAAPSCASLSAEVPDAFTPGTYSPFTPGDTSQWDWFDMHVLAGGASSFTGGTFDGTYVYFAGHGNYLARYNTLDGGFSEPSSWRTFKLTNVLPSVLVGFAGAVFDGRFVYFIPSQYGSTNVSTVARFDTATDAFTDPNSWQLFDVSTSTRVAPRSRRAFSVESSTERTFTSSLGATALRTVGCFDSTRDSRRGPCSRPERCEPRG